MLLLLLLLLLFLSSLSAVGPWEKLLNFLVGCFVEQQPIKKVKEYSKKFHYPRVSPDDQPLTEKPEDSGFEIANTKVLLSAVLLAIGPNF